MNRKGITLVALIVTIIVLLILAGITINLTISEDGIIKRAQEAGKNYVQAAENEKNQLAEFLNETDKIIENVIQNSEEDKEIQRVYLVKDGIEMAEFEECNIEKHTQGDGYSIIETKLTGERASYQLVDIVNLDEYKSLKVDIEVTNMIYKEQTAFELMICANDKPQTGKWFRVNTIFYGAVDNQIPINRCVYEINLEDVEGNYGIGIRKNVATDTQVSYKLYNLWLEK